jgi:hypothetical protein
MEQPSLALWNGEFVVYPVYISQALAGVYFHLFDLCNIPAYF